ncbi:MAG: pirin family protein [Polyangiaceae bacterium]|nr:pirin family protein [Polyangiaceae bacterium]
MSVFPTNEPECTKAREATVDTVIEAKPRKIDGFEVGRALPAIARRHVGPFVFFDHMGPAQLEPGHGMDVRPHPHIGLCTVTYLFEGEIVHRDSLGVVQSIRPGAVNWMTAGKGIVHSERTSAELRKSGSPLHGLQLWVALMKEHEETDPAFQHCAAADLPELSLEGVPVRVLAGSAYGATSPVKTLSPLFYVEAKLRAGDRIALPTDHEERGVYVVEGALGCGPDRIERRRLMVFKPGADVTLIAADDARIVLLGGAPPDGQRHIWWNFVSSSKERMDQAKRDWEERRFAEVPGETERIPLPER